MIRTYFGLEREPFHPSHISLLPMQEEILATLRVHCQQGGLCVLLGQPGTGKSVLKQTLLTHHPKRMITPVVNRTLHTYHNTLRILCEAFQIDYEGGNHKCEGQLIDEAHRLNRQGKMLAPVIDDAHYLPIEALRKIRLLLEDFPKNHNLILLGQGAFNTTLQLRVNDDIRTRITYSATLQRLAPDAVTAFIRSQLDQVGLPHSTFTEAALNLIVRSSEGTLRAVKNLCVGAMIEAVRGRTKTIDTAQVNAVLLQPHWRHDQQGEPAEPIVIRADGTGVERRD